ncbi:MAG: mycofactocin system GMC family oxidoreductase MftG [Rhodococcus sp.]|nr:mycofactocin system GMC family oxidoreductase MftG [Rhodococcus sp. (in: high G+C Gram-positive bacteria)]
MGTPDLVADVVVIGGGSGGCVVASRLGEDAGRSVLLVESGPGYSSVEDCPVRDYRVMQVGPSSPWAARYSADLMPGLPTHTLRGRVLGGSGAVNGAYFVRAREEDFARWPASWSYADVLPYFVRTEHDHDFTGPDHGTTGPVPVRRRSASTLADISSAFVAAAAEVGHPTEEDKNGGEPSGVGPVPLNVSDETRMSSAIAYLLPALHRSNVKVLCETSATRVIFSGGKVSGVELVRDGSRITVRTTCVVAAAGAIETPMLLMRSGIGDSRELAQHGITVVSDLSGVGRSAADHPEVLIPVRAVEQLRRSDDCPALEVCLNMEDIEIRPYTAGFDQLVPGSGEANRYVGVGLMKSRSRGSIRMVSADPDVAPQIEYRYLESEADRRHLRQGISEARHILESASMRRIAETPEVEDTDGWMLRHLATSQHLSSTCRMGDDADRDAVVDERCRVKGVEGLYIADSSAMPRVPSRGPHATTLMIGERVADFIRM